MTWLLLASAVVSIGALYFLRERRAWHPGLGRVLATGFALYALALYGFFRTIGFDLEHDATFFWSTVVFGAAVIAFVASASTKRVAAWELPAAVAIVMLMVTAALRYHGGLGLASSPFRASLIAPAVLLLCGYFGSSLGFLWLGGGTTETSWSYEAKIGRRFLLSKASASISVITTISVVGVCLGVAAVIFSLAVLAGFGNDLQQKIIGTHSHILLQRNDKRPFVVDQALLKTIDETSGVLDRAPAIEGEVAVASSSNYSGALVIGIDPAQSSRVLTVLSQITAGSIEPLIGEMTPVSIQEVEQIDVEDSEFLPPASLPNIVVGEEMARNLAVQPGDTVRMLSPTLETLTPVGPAPKSVGFRVAGIFSSQMYEYDAKLAFISADAARNFFELTTGAVTGMMLRVNDPERSDRIGASLLRSVGGEPYSVLDWKRRNETLFSALKLERVVAFVTLAFIILVASFSIVNTLTMSIIEKKKEIAILKTMGSRDIGVMKIFLIQGLIVGAFGALLGAALGLSLIGFFKAFGFWIPDEVYYVDSLPIHLDVGEAFLVVVAAMLIVWNFAVFPALRGTRLTPVEGLRDG